MKNILLLFIVSLILVLSKVKRLIVDGDTFWAIKAGEWISLNGEVPRADSFSWTANGNPWVAHEWLYDLLIYYFYNNFGYYGIVILVSIGAFFVLYFLWKLYLEENKNLALTLVLFTIVVFMLRFAMSARPHLYGYIFFIYFFYVLYRKRKLLWTLAPITVIWANMHGSVVLGIAMVLLQFTYDTVYSYIEDKKLRLSIDYLIAAIIVPLCSLINPYGIELWKASYLQITYEMNKQINEWRPPDFSDPGWLILYLTIILITVFVSFSNKGVINKRQFYLLAIYLIGTFYEAITGIRYFPYLAVCWGVFVLSMLPNDIFTGNSWNKKIFIIYASLLIIIVLSIGKVPTTIEEAVDGSKWPLEAVKHLENKRTFNDYMWGGYLVYLNIPVFIDGRADVYWKNSDVFKDQLDTVRLNQDPLDIFKKYDVEQVIIPIDKPLDIYLKRAGAIETYRDETAVIYNIKL